MHHGMLTVYKEAGYTSSDAVARLRGILHMRKIGHTGTLDPDAEGVLPMCLGNATRICELIADREKEYVAVMRLGVRTDTQDMSGEILSQVPEERIPGMILQKYDTAGPLSDTMDSGLHSQERTDPEEILSSGDVCKKSLPAGDISEKALPAGDVSEKALPSGDVPEMAGRKDADAGVCAPEDKTLAEESVSEKIKKDCVCEGASVSAVISVTDEEQELICGRIAAAAAAFTGEIEQIPPMYSAIKVNGKRLYDMARKGITVERKPRRITIYSLNIEKVELPFVTMRVRCSKGTYIRTLCEGLGDALGTGAAMQSLLRTRVGQFTLDQARTLDELERIAKTEPDSMPSLIRPVDSFFSDLPAAECDGEALRLLKNGNPLMPKEFRFLSPEEDPQRQWSCESRNAGEDSRREYSPENRNTVEDSRRVYSPENRNTVEDSRREYSPENRNTVEDSRKQCNPESRNAEEDPQRQWNCGSRTPETGEACGNPAEKDADFGCPESALPGIEAGEKVIRMYDPEGSFYGLYRTKKKQGAQGRYYAYKMFLPEK